MAGAGSPGGGSDGGPDVLRAEGHTEWTPCPRQLRSGSGPGQPRQAGLSPQARKQAEDGWRVRSSCLQM